MIDTHTVKRIARRRDGVGMRTELTTREDIMDRVHVPVAGFVLIELTNVHDMLVGGWWLGLRA